MLEPYTLLGLEGQGEFGGLERGKTSTLEEKEKGLNL